MLLRMQEGGENHIRPSLRQLPQDSLPHPPTPFLFPSTVRPEKQFRLVCAYSIAWRFGRRFRLLYRRTDRRKPESAEGCTDFSAMMADAVRS